MVRGRDGDLGANGTDSQPVAGASSVVTVVRVAAVFSQPSAVSVTVFEPEQEVRLRKNGTRGPSPGLS